MTNSVLDVVSVKGIQIELAHGQMDVQVWGSGWRPRLAAETQESLARTVTQWVD